MAWSDRIFPRPSARYRALLRDKYCLSAFVSQCAHIPEQRRLDEGVGAAIESLGLPMVVKGVAGSGGRKTRIVRSLGEATAAAARLRREGMPSFAQRYVSGPTFLVGGTFSQGRPLRIYAGVKLAQYPPRTGPASLIESVRDDQLIEQASRVFAALEWSGVASADFVRDAQGRYWFLEMNPRPWGSIAAAKASGVDLWSPLAAMLAGEESSADLRFAEGVAYSIVPLAFLSPGSWFARGGIVSSLRAERNVWLPMGQAFHLTHRLARMASRWTG
jgi:biotin carboxylase